MIIDDQTIKRVIQERYDVLIIVIQANIRNELKECQLIHFGCLGLRVVGWEKSTGRLF